MYNIFPSLYGSMCKYAGIFCAMAGTVKGMVGDPSLDDMYIGFAFVSAGLVLYVLGDHIKSTADFRRIESDLEDKVNNPQKT